MKDYIGVTDQTDEEEKPAIKKMGSRFALLGVLLVIIVLLLLVVPTVWNGFVKPEGPGCIPQIKRPESGYLITGTPFTGGTNSFEIDDHGGSYDSIYVFTPVGVKKALFGFYMRSKDNYVVTNIPSGSYNLYFMEGSEWNTCSKIFNNVKRMEVLEKPIVVQGNVKTGIEIFAPGEFVDNPLKSKPVDSWISE